MTPAVLKAARSTAAVHSPSPATQKLFAEFWAVYPRKTGRLAALKAFTRIDPDAATVAMYAAAIDAQGRSKQWCDGFIPHAATWLNGERWTDEIEPAPHIVQAPRVDLRQAAAVARAVGPRAEIGSWRDRCTHDPECQTPTQCELARLRQVTE